MDEAAPRTRRRWQFRIGALLALPVLCAPAFFWLAMRNRVPPVERWEREYRWCSNPLGPFWPAEGEWVSGGDELVKLARVNGPWDGRHRGQSWCLTPDGMVRSQWHIGIDAGGDDLPAPAAGLAKLPALLRALPPSDPAAGPTNRVLVALPVGGYWTVRSYRRDALPKEVIALAEALDAKDFLPRKEETPGGATPAP